MLNQSVLVGRIIETPTIIKNDEKTTCQITLAVNRSYKNADGIYETDFIPCILWNGIAENCVEYLNKGDLVGIKGRLQTNENKELEIIAEKVTFLSSKKEDKKDEEN